MAQTHHFNWKDDDRTDWLNRYDIAAVPHGLYRGFDGDLADAAGMNLVLKHTITGFLDVDRDGLLRENLGAVKTKQGVIVVEDAQLIIPIASNAANTEPRIDLVVMQHEYVITPGGVDATYLVIQGTPSATPVAPALPLPNKQIILGTLYLPGLTNNLQNVGVVYTRAESPNFANDGNLVRTIGNQTIHDRKKFDLISGTIAEMIYNGPGLSLTATAGRNHYYVVNINPSWQTVSTLIIPDAVAGVRDPGQWFDITTRQALKLIPGGNIAFEGDVDSIHIYPGETFRVINYSDTANMEDPTYQAAGKKTYRIIKGGEVRRDKETKMYSMLALAKGTASFDTGTGTIILYGDGNFYDISLPMGFPAIAIRGIQVQGISHEVSGPLTQSGNVVRLRFLDSGGAPGTVVSYMQDNASGLPGGYLPFDINANPATLLSNGLEINHGATVEIVEDFYAWRVVAHRDVHYNIDNMVQTYEALNQSFEHHWLKLQSLDYVDLGFQDLSGGTLKLTNEGNHFKTTVPPGQVINDITINGAQARPGTTVSVKISHASWLPGTSIGTYFNSTGTGPSMFDDRRGKITLYCDNTTSSTTIVFLRGLTKWEVLSNTAEADYNKFKNLSLPVSVYTAPWNSYPGGDGVRINKQGRSVNVSAIMLRTANNSTNVLFTLPAEVLPVSNGGASVYRVFGTVHRIDAFSSTLQSTQYAVWLNETTAEVTLTGAGSGTISTLPSGSLWYLQLNYSLNVNGPTQPEA